MSDGRGMSPELKRRVFEAVQSELVELGVDRFSVEGVARRSGVDSSVILRQWRDRRVLLMEVMLARTSAASWNPDTGSLYSDLDAVAALAVEVSASPAGRAEFRRVLPAEGDIDLGEIRSDLWAARFRDAAQVLHRAAGRAQLRDGIVPEEAIRMFAAAFYYDVIFNDAPVRPEYAEQVMDIFLHGVIGAAGRDRPWPNVEQLLRQGDATDPGSIADQTLEIARRAVVLTRVWADALLDPLVLLEAVRDGDGAVIDFVCRDANRAACEQAGLARSEVVGSSVSAMQSQTQSSPVLAAYTHCLESGEPLVMNNFVHQHFDERQVFDLRATSAGVDLIAVTWRDVTDRVEAAQQDKRYRQLMDHSAIPAALTTPDGRFVSVNQAMATLLGHDIDTLLTMRWQDFAVPEIVAGVSDIVAEMVAGRRDSYRSIKHYVRADGVRVHGDLSLSCIRQPDGEVEYLIAQVIDVGSYLDGSRRQDSAAEGDTDRSA